jgi:hypothetical protein
LGERVFMGTHPEWGKLKNIGGTPPNAFALHSSYQLRQKNVCSCRWPRLGDGWLNKSKAARHRDERKRSATCCSAGFRSDLSQLRVKSTHYRIATVMAASPQ